jgi:S1-C subfamily serine protease
VAVAAGLVGVAGLAGVGLGHAAWPQRASATAPTTNSGNSGSQGLSNPNGSSGQLPFGSGDSPFGSFGSGGSSGDSPFNFGSGGSSGGGSSSSGGSSATGSTSQTDAIAAKISPALVDINSTFGYQGAQGAGTGIVLTSNGEVLTNNHVINGATKITATDVGNGKTYTATVLGYDDSHDVALLKLNGASGLQTARLADSSKVAVGESVVAVGNAGGTGGTPSNAGGSVTALNQSITAGDDLDGVSEQLSGLIEVNADIQPGDSGGSLVNTSGAVIGIDTAASQGFNFQTSANQGFAIPINQAKAIANQILSGHGTATTHVGKTAFLGVELASSSSQSNSGGFFGNSSGSNSGANGSGANDSGAAVAEVVSGGPAAQAGLAAGDTITSVDGTSVDSSSSIAAALVGHHPGDRIQIGWVDSSGQSHTATVHLGSGPPA